MISSRNRLVVAVFFAIAAAGFMLPFWPLSAAGVLLIAVFGRWYAALILGLLLDLAWGAPLGPAHFLFFPFTLLAAIAALARSWGARHIIGRNPPDRL